MGLVDTHAHLGDPVFDGDRGEVLRRARDAGVTAVIAVGETLTDARRNLALAVEYNERYWPALLNLGILEAEEGRQVEAMSLFQEVLDLDPLPLVKAEVHYRMGQIFIALGQQQKALPHFVASAEVEPKGQWGKKSEEYLKLLR